MITDRDVLWVRVMYGKYVKGRDFWHTGAGGQMSWGWKSILHTRPLLRERMCYRVWYGVDISIWRDPWIPSLPEFTPTACAGVNISDLVIVRSLMNSDGSRWNEPWVFSLGTADAIIKMLLHVAGVGDSLFWSLES